MAEHKTNSQKLDAVLEHLNELEKRLAQREHLDKMVMDHDEFIHGNGTPGAKAQLAVISASQARIGAINLGIVIALVIDIISGFFK